MCASWGSSVERFGVTVRCQTIVERPTRHRRRLGSSRMHRRKSLVLLCHGPEIVNEEFSSAWVELHWADVSEPRGAHRDAETLNPLPAQVTMHPRLFEGP